MKVYSTGNPLYGKYIAIEGVIGVGKTTLALLLSRRFNLEPVLEVVEENPFLKLFYEDMEKWAFQTQVFFLLSRYKQQEEISQQRLFSGGVVSDYMFEKDRIFASLTLKGEEWRLYLRLFEILRDKVPKPDFIIYLKATTDVLMHRIALRDRPFERNIQRGYIERLREAYEGFFDRYVEVPVLKIDTTEMDFVRNPKDLEKIVREVVDFAREIG